MGNRKCNCRFWCSCTHVFVEEETVRGIRRFMESYGQGKLREKLFRFHGDDTDEVVERWAARWLDAGFRQWNIESLLPRTTCPVLSIQGADDEYATIRQVEGIAKVVSGPAYGEIVPDCGHTAHSQTRERVLSSSAGFIESLLRNE